jgi:hypothetical protein
MEIGLPSLLLEDYQLLLLDSKKRARRRRGPIIGSATLPSPFIVFSPDLRKKWPHAKPSVAKRSIVHVMQIDAVQIRYDIVSNVIRPPVRHHAVIVSPLDDFL